MENKKPEIKVECLLKEIKQLEAHIAQVKGKIDEIEREEKLENCAKNFLEGRRNILRESIEFYQKYYKEKNTKLVEKLTSHLKFSVAQECYDKLLEMYQEKYLHSNGFDLSKDLCLEDNLFNEKQIHDLQEEAETLKSTIEHNSNVITGLLAEFPDLSE